MNVNYENLREGMRVKFIKAKGGRKSQDETEYAVGVIVAVHRQNEILIKKNHVVYHGTIHEIVEILP